VLLLLSANSYFEVLQRVRLQLNEAADGKLLALDVTPCNIDH
jgi:hypothetical protein